ncbi:hypothetical protein [Candidatus Methanarcanum hacksteinii]|uniref:hypothetical protein n=1 Tax=Candidatus Methanarcanum hacksteinii TaxID=2911857 RepID=UPI0037DD6920
MIPLSSMGKRGPILCGKVPPELYASAKKLIDGEEFKTLNDIVEKAVWHFLNEKEKSEGIEGGDSVAD